MDTQNLTIAINSSNDTKPVLNTTTTLHGFDTQNLTIAINSSNDTKPVFNTTTILHALDTQNLSIAISSSNDTKPVFNTTTVSILANNVSLHDDENDKRDDTLAESNTSDDADLGGASNIHIHLTVPRYYSPYEEVPFLYFINSSISTYIDQEKHYFSLHMGSSPYSPTYGLFLSDVPSGTYTFHIGREYNQTWFV